MFCARIRDINVNFWDSANKLEVEGSIVSVGKVRENENLKRMATLYISNV